MAQISVEIICSPGSLLRGNLHHSAEEENRIVLAGLRGEESISALCCCEGISDNLYYTWSKELVEAGKGRFPATQRVRRHRLRYRSCDRRPWL
ncbi:hypothetical protein DSM110093_03041 [Sulfitobacter sp. DSM 110093]|nr:hypothetical protein DSM110093_03041 [Sulfitobacter sp. DSM 110093]